MVAAQPAQMIPSKAGLEEFIRVTLGKVGECIMATPLPRGAGTITSLVRADGLIRIPAASEGVDAEKPVLTELLISEEQLWQTLVVIGSHDNTLDVLATLLRRHHPHLRLSSAHVGSTGGLMALKNRRAHFGGSHLFDPQTNSYNVPYIQRLLPDLPLKLVNLVHRAQGLMVLAGNPKNIQGFEDLTRPEVRFCNRQRGSGTRVSPGLPVGSASDLPGRHPWLRPGRIHPHGGSRQCPVRGRGRRPGHHGRGQGPGSGLYSRGHRAL